ncbi:MAG: Asp23/Gls24 family envelope stress response protein [Clostridiales bacterium]|nr:Asp23/Gls24 family envelope stress response protein [Clostridiales bacterium]
MSDNNNGFNNTGDLVISEDVIATIAINSIKDIEGISGFAQKPVGFDSFFNNSEQANKSVRMVIKDNDVKIHIFVNLLAGYKIPTVAEKIQTSVKDAIQNMTGKIVSKVDVTVVNIDFSEPNDDE